MSTRIVERAPALPQRPATRTLDAYPATWTAVLLVCDVILFVIASELGALIGFHHWDKARLVQHLLIEQSIFVFVWVLVFFRLGLYRRTFALSKKDEFYYTVAALSLGTIPQLVFFTIYPGISPSRIALSFALLFSIILVGSTRTFLHGIRESQRFQRHRRVAVVGEAERIMQAAGSLNLDCETLLVAVDDMDGSIADVGLARDTDIERMDWFRQAHEWACDTIILTEIVPPSVMTHLLELAARSQIQVAFAPPRIMQYAYSLSLQTNGRQALIVPSRLSACTPRAQLFKRIMDIALGGIAIVLFAPVMLLAAVAVFLDSGRPILYRQARVGAQGRIFNMLKFRSMRVNAEAETGAVWASSEDPRRTRTGAFLRRFSIDELPQFFNVLRGDMSLVGPRPERPSFVEQFRQTVPRYDERHLIRPGITGWSQVHMKRVLDPSAVGEKLDYDLQYLENWSPFLDVSVLFQTLVEFVFHQAG